MKSNKRFFPRFEHFLIEYCAPTLAGLKTGNLFSFPKQSHAEWKYEYLFWKKQLRPLGVRFSVLKEDEKRALVYVFRSTLLGKDLNNGFAAGLLTKYGYGSLEPRKALCLLKRRLAESEDFPHEIGLFLGYPPEDVAGFIRHCGKNCKCSGCWKVYGNREEAELRFARYKKCSEVYRRLWNEGWTVLQLTAAV